MVLTSVDFTFTLSPPRFSMAPFNPLITASPGGLFPVRRQTSGASARYWRIRTHLPFHRADTNAELPRPFQVGFVQWQPPIRLPDPRRQQVSGGRKEYWNTGKTGQGR
jgi:hypothetical protein